ncbi:sugar ABC transporter ATP-binding protein [Roseomonas sp. GC11]|uniref:sugar ABC transporter ATP-binding protein n=1 Tax=Roseomonas sp. GC11 TaxID=2950546 RepID=UPI0021091AFF|nr:sugar ABC transporter ATP-binding protein [Roseomonas sp. GC11]MCQ4161625.1 sugar ABC transporter ATP-binding protein [Roseomonas sp. GC11]
MVTIIAPPATPGLVAEGIAKSFGGTRALAGVSLAVRPGEIVGLMGANGAGKSTLVNILGGALRPDAGRLWLDGRPYAPASPRAAIAAGVVTLHQSTERIGIPGLSVADALVLDRFADGRSGFFVSRAAVRRQALAVQARAGFDLPLEADFASLGTAGRQLVGIARALSASPRLLMLDEPTASLSAAEAERLFAILEELAGRGLAILYISHRTGDLERLAHRVEVLRGGVVAASLPRPVDFGVALSAMIGRDLARGQGAARARPEGPPVLALRGLRLRPGLPPLELEVRAGEVVAITGPLGAGKSRLLRALFGADSVAGGVAGGEILLDGAPWRPRGPAEAIARGVHLAAEDRRRSSLMPPGWPGSGIAATIALPHLGRWFPGGLLRAGTERRAAEHAIRALSIRAAGPFAGLETLSGGNQQKVVLARWLAETPRLLLLDEPFQGVDVGARAEIIATLRARTDIAVLVATSDPAEALDVADRSLVLDEAGLRPLAPAALPDE